MNISIKNHIRLALSLGVSVIAVGAANAIATCDYPDPVLDSACTLDGLNVKITCRMVSNTVGWAGSRFTEDCSYLWCDNTRLCTHGNNYLRQRRTKQLRVNSDPNKTCMNKYVVDSVVDSDPWCCECQMPPAPEWPSTIGGP